MHFFQSPATGQNQYTWEIKFEDAVKEVWQDILKTKLTKELKVLNILIEHITRISQYALPEYFSIDRTKSLEDVINSVFSKFCDFQKYSEYHTNAYTEFLKSNEI